jgi:hypothetical protein
MKCLFQINQLQLVAHEFFPPSSLFNPLETFFNWLKMVLVAAVFPDLPLPLPDPLAPFPET